MALRPLVSIIVLSHNYGRYLAEAIESALGQTYSPVEVLLTDDGSTDDSVQIARSYGDRIRVLIQDHEGVERSANRAVEEARGELFCFLSADDTFESDYVAALVAALHSNNGADYAYCRARLIGARSGLTRTFPFSPYHLARRLNYINSSALTRRHDYLAVGGYDEALSDVALEDWDFWLRMIEAGKRGTYVREPLLRWRRHEGGSRNPEAGEAMARSIATVRARHAPLRRTLSDVRGHLTYGFDLTIALLEVVVGISRIPWLLRAIERLSWHCFLRWHLPRLRAGGTSDLLRKLSK